MPRSNFAGTRLAIPLSLLAVARSDAAEPLRTSPAACRPGRETVLRVTGPGVDGELRALCSLDASSLVVEEATEGAAVLRLSIPEDAAPGPIGLWLANKDGPLPPITLMVDDLPTVVPENDHRSVDSAQTLVPFACLSGISRASGSDHYRVPLVAGQRVAFEVLTQPLDSSMGPVVFLRDGHGKRLLQFDHDGIGPGCRFEFRAPEEADYFLEIHDNRFRGGLRYHLRVGDFPIVRHASPMGVRVGETTSVTAVSNDGDAFGPTKFVSEETPNGSPGIATVIHPVRRPGGQSEAWVPRHVSPYPQVTSNDGEPTSGPLEIPSVVHGRLVEPNWSDPLTALEVHPSEIALSGPRSRWQLVVDASGERTSTRDRTRGARIRSADPSVADVRGTVVFPISNGNTEIVVELEGHRRTIPVTVRELEADPPVGFASEVLAALSKQGCKSGACHASPSDKGTASGPSSSPVDWSTRSTIFGHRTRPRTKPSWKCSRTSSSRAASIAIT